MTYLLQDAYCSIPAVTSQYHRQIPEARMKLRAAVLLSDKLQHYLTTRLTQYVLRSQLQIYYSIMSHLHNCAIQNRSLPSTCRHPRATETELSCVRV